MSLEISRRTLVRTGGLVAVTAPFLAACGSDSGSGGSSGSASTNIQDLLERGKKQGYLRVAIANEPPYTKVEPDGTVTGAEPEIFRAVVKQMGIPEIQGTVTGYDSMIPGLKADRWDAVTAGLFMKQSRCAEVAYSEPTLVSTESYAVPNGNPKNITTIQDVIDNGDLKIAILPGGFEEGILQGKKVPDGQLVRVKDGRSGIETVKAGRADAFLLPTLSLKSLQQKDKGIDVTDPISDAPKTGSGAAFRKSDQKFVEAYNVELKKYKDSDAFATLMNKWGFDPEASRQATTEELCSNPG